MFLKSIVLLASVSLIKFLPAQYYNQAGLRSVDSTRTAFEGDMYLDTITNDYRIGLTHGKLGLLNDKQNIDSLVLKNDTLRVYITNGNSANIDVSSIRKQGSVGDIKSGFQITDHDGWYLLNGRSIGTLPIIAQAAATSLGFATNLPNATDRVLKQLSGVETIGSTGGQATTTLSQANIPNYSLPTSTSTSNGNHNHTGTANSAGDHNHTGTATSAGDHNHTGTANSAGDHNHTFPRVDRTQAITAVGTNRTFYGDPGNTSTSTNGAHTHTLTINNNGAHTHTLAINNNGAHTHVLTINNNGNHTHDITVTSGGSGTPFSQYQPFLVTNHFVYLGQ